MRRDPRVCDVPSSFGWDSLGSRRVCCRVGNPFLVGHGHQGATWSGKGDAQQDVGQMH